MAEYIVAIDVTRVRFPADAHCQYQNKLIGVAFDCNSFVFLYRGRDNIYQIYQGLANHGAYAHAGSRTRVTSMGGLYDAVTLHALNWFHFQRCRNKVVRSATCHVSHLANFFPCLAASQRHESGMNHASHSFRGKFPYCPILFHERASLPSPIFLWGAKSAHGELHFH